MFYPCPRKKTVGREFSFGHTPSVSLRMMSPELDSDKYSVALGEFAPGNEVITEALIMDTRELTFIPETGCISDEIYKLLISEKNGCVKIQIHCSSDKSMLHALFSVKKMLRADCFPIGEIFDYPLFPVRGFIEGFYGRPWSFEERTDMLSLMAEYGENTYYYSPKDDKYLRREWHIQYPEAKLAELKTLKSTADRLGMTFYYCISPGMSIHYSSDKDFKALCRKITQVFSAGIGNFGLFLDDIPEKLVFDEDKRKFTETVYAHIFLIKNFYAFIKSLNPDCRLTVCPMEYCGEGNEYYIQKLSAGVPKDISFFFTGSDICSKTITAKQAAYFSSHTGRAPLYWDNFPVNDAEMFKEMHLAPLRGRDSSLYREAEGLISNPMEYSECSKFPLITAACYLWNPEEYSPEDAFSDALRRLTSSGEAADLRLLGDHFRTSCLRDVNSRIMGDALSRAMAAFNSGDTVNAVKIVFAYAESVRLSSLRLACRHGKLYRELTQWIDKYIMMSDILGLSLDVIRAAGSERTEKRAALAEKMRQYNDNATVLTAFCFREYIEYVLEMFS